MAAGIPPDADSEGHEGKFYCWTKTELSELLSAEELAPRDSPLRHHGGRQFRGSQPEPLKHQNVLGIVDPKLTDAEQTLLASARKKMDAVRAKRVRPHLDDKVLSSWNGLMLGAVARAAAVLDEKEYLQAAKANYAFTQKHFWDAESKTMYHRWRRRTRQCATSRCLRLPDRRYTAPIRSHPDKYLEQAIALADRMIELFYDQENSGFWQGTGNTGSSSRVKEDYDGAMPSANSVASLALLKLHKITERKQYRTCAERTLKLFADRMEKPAAPCPICCRP